MSRVFDAGNEHQWFVCVVVHRAMTEEEARPSKRAGRQRAGGIVSGHGWLQRTHRSTIPRQTTAHPHRQAIATYYSRFVAKKWGRVWTVQIQRFLGTMCLFVMAWRTDLWRVPWVRPFVRGRGRSLVSRVCVCWCLYIGVGGGAHGVSVVVAAACLHTDSMAEFAPSSSW